MPTLDRPSDLRASIEELPFAADLSDGEIDALAALATRIELPRGQAVIREGEEATVVFALSSGALSIEKHRRANGSQIVGFLFPGDLFGIVHDKRFTYSVSSVAASILLRFDRDAFETLCDRYPRIQHAVLQLASNELAAAQDHLVVLGCKHANERIATFLLRMDARADASGRRTEGLVWLPMRRSDIADHLGLTLETVSRVFSDFKRRGLLTVRGMREVVIEDRDTLADLADAVD